MSQNKDFEDALNLSIDKEKDAVSFYRRAAEIVKSPGAAEMCREFSSEEQKHVKLLENASGSQSMKAVGKNILPPSMDLTKYLLNEDITESSTPQEVMIVAMKKEASAVALYAEMASALKGNDLEEVFQSLCDMEKEHKERLESEYEKHFMPDN